MKKVIIMRGCSGSGKSTWIRNNYPDATVVSADRCSIDDEGVCGFDATGVGEAHNQCLRKFVGLCEQNDYGVIIVDNTNIQVYEITPYYRIAEAFGWEVEIVCLMVHPDIAFKRNIHNVPEEIIHKMARNLLEVKLPPWWKERVIYPENC